jgi:hypothetical protein
MCNLYSITTNQEAILRLFRVVNRYVGNLPPMPGVFPDYPAPVVRNAGAERELAMMRWGMPPPPEVWRPAGDQHPQHLVAALAGLAEAEKPMPGAGKQLLGIRQRPTRRPARRTSSGSPSTTIGRCSPSPGSGLSSGATAGPNQNRSPALTTSMAS